jgi:hypothetical protein
MSSSTGKNQLLTHDSSQTIDTIGTSSLSSYALPSTNLHFGLLCKIDNVYINLSNL